MKIHGITVSVQYADLLGQGLDRWMSGLDSLLVITDHNDRATMELCQRDRITPCFTDAFTRNGAAFNKGAAQQEFWHLVPREGWILSFDADVIPPADWREQLETANLEPGYLYGCNRYDENERRIKDDTHGYGYFQLFHASDPLAQTEPFFDTFWTHAGNGDSNIMLRWRNAGKLAPALPLKLIHAGGPSHNWYGRGKHDEFRKMERERMRRGGGWKSLEGEKIQVPT